MPNHSFSNYACQFGAGAVGAPSVYFSTDTTTGWYRSAANEICATVSGTPVMTIKAGLVTFAAGSASVPGLNFGDADTGPYHYGTNQLGFTAGGAARFVIGSTNISLADFNVVRNAASAMGFYSYNNATAQARTNYYCARGTEASPASLQSGDENGSFHFRSWGTGTTYNTAAKMMVLATENHSNTACGTKFVFQTTPNASTTAATALEIGQDKTLTIKGSIDHDGSTIGFFGTAPTTKQTMTGAKSGNAALASVIALLAAYGLGVDNTTA
jgi:hypothetical protein